MDSEAAQAETLEGRQVGDFVLREQIGRGGQGVVHRAEQPALGREAAVKVVPTRGKSEGAVMRFLREVKIAAQLDHPFAAHIYAFGAEPDLLWVAMEYVHGTPLDQVLRLDGPIPLRRFLPFLERLCEVVHSAHEQGIVHRDIKPANVMVLSRAGRLLPKLLDLGIAKATSSVDAPSEVQPPRSPEGQGVASALDVPVEESTRVVTPPTADALSTSPSVVDLRSLPSSLDAPLTKHGAVVGSPPYMAPEAWQTPMHVDGRVDVYALGVLTYECLTGQRPFNAGLMSRLADLHVHAEVPSLGRELGAPLDHVLRRALAKRAEDRFATPVALASALRVAASQSGSGLPRLAEDLRDAWLTYAPQPLAETLVLLDAARSEEQAWDALGMFKRATLRYLGALAIAVHTQREHGRSNDAELLAALAPMGRGAPSDAEWATLIRAACRPFFGDPRRCVLPELIAFVRVREPMDVLAATGDEQGRSADESENLPQAVRELEEVMMQLSFVAEYALGLRRGDELQALTGLRRTPRATLAVADLDQAAEEAVVLVDREHRLCLRVSPLVLVRPAALGFPEEVFLLDGAGARGMKQRSFPTLFERQDEDARAWFDANLPLSADGQAGVSEERAPYLGLSTFRTEDASSFFGREREVEGFVNRLRVQGLLAVVGPSGAGKSSFIQAGVLPALFGRLTAVTLRPGRAPLSTLVSRLEREGVSGLSVDGLRRDPMLLTQRARLHAQMTGQPTLLVIDQLEELFTLCLDVEEREVYAAALVALSEHAQDAARVVVTLRDDFLVRAEELPAFRSRLGAGLQLVTTPQRADLLRILVEPLAARRYAFEDEALIREMVDAVQAQPGALALLSFTASQLWEGRDKHFHRLTRRAYLALGGVGGALAQHAEATLTALDEREQALARHAFRHLVTSHGTRATLTRSELEQLLGSDAAASSMLEKLVSARLLVTQEAEGGSDRVEIIHEALLSAWPRLAGWQREDAEGARLRDGLRAAARQWDDRGRPKGLLWRGDALDEYRMWRARYPGALTDGEEAFAASSIRDARRGQRIRRVALTSAMAALALFAAFMWRASKAERKAHTASEALLRDSYLDQGRQLLLRGDPLQSLVYLDAAQRLGLQSPALDFLVTMASLPLSVQEQVVQRQRGGLLDAAFSPDGRYVATGDGEGHARVFDIAAGTTVWEHRFSAWAEGVAFVDGSEDLLVVADDTSVWRWRTNTQLRAGPNIGRGYDYQVVSAAHEVIHGSYNGDAAVWDWQTGASTLLPSKTSTEMVGISPDGQRAYTSHWAGAGFLWNVPAAQRIAPLPEDPTRGAFGPNGRFAILSSDDGRLTVFDERGREVRSIPYTHKTGAAAIAWSPDAKTIATGGGDNMVRLWDSTSLAPIHEYAGHAGTPQKLSFVDDGKILMSFGEDGSVRFWDVRSDSELGELAGHTSAVASAQVSVDGKRLLTASYDGSARIWRWRDAQRLHVLSVDANVELERDFGDAHVQLPAPLPSYGDASPTGDAFGSYDDKRNLSISRTDGSACRIGDHHPVRSIAFSHDGTQIFTADLGRTSIGVWKTSDCSLVRELAGHTAEVRALRVSDDGRYLVSGSMDRTARLWDAATGALLRTFSGNGAPVVHVDMSADDALVYASSAAVGLNLDAAMQMSVWRAENGDLVWSRKPGERSFLASFLRVAGGRLVLWDWTGTLELVDEKTGATSHTAKLPTSIFDLVASPDGRRIIATMRHDNALVIDADTLTIAGELDVQSAHSAVFTPSSQLALVSGGNKLSVFDIESRRLLARLPGADVAAMSALHPRALLVQLFGPPKIWDLAVDPIALRGLHELVRCRVPFQMRNGRVIKATPPADCADGVVSGAPAPSR